VSPVFQSTFTPEDVPYGIYIPVDVIGLAPINHTYAGVHGGRDAVL
jgi:hypothetical protein